MIRQSTIAKHIGRKYGRLTIKEFSHQIGDCGYFYKCACECGNEPIIRMSTMQQGTTVSCGCYGREVRIAALKGNTHVRLSRGQSSFNSVFKKYADTAKRRGHSFKLTKEQFHSLTHSDCYYCGAPPSTEFKLKDGYGSYTYTGIDRVDNCKGYELINCVPCCRPCNSAKNSISKEMVFKLYNLLFGQELETTSSQQLDG